jgi:hypothetical protein
MTTLWRLGAPIVVLGLASLACTGRDCTLIGGESGVNFQLRPILTTRAADVRVCIDDVCVTRRARIDRWESIFVSEPRLTEARSVDVTVTVMRPGSGTDAYHEEGSVDLYRLEPNGPGCDPVVYTAGVLVREDGLRQVPP